MSITISSVYPFCWHSLVSNFAPKLQFLSSATKPLWNVELSAQIKSIVRFLFNSILFLNSISNSITLDSTLTNEVTLISRPFVSCSLNDALASLGSLCYSDVSVRTSQDYREFLYGVCPIFCIMTRITKSQWLWLMGRSFGADKWCLL